MGVCISPIFGRENLDKNSTKYIERERERGALVLVMNKRSEVGAFLLGTWP